ncbi:hypothetical protein TNCV_4563441 [Trichonephila clavipes]|uniref:Uncharacterized protein n=1 Tax=Trichonephila clavipes TaxID=2585209 RepID=A0A8X7BDM6_TRICX|nr:hypothetical protein TNCV_4563441 [Trichonephila clavipes]
MPSSYPQASYSMSRYQMDRIATSCPAGSVSVHQGGPQCGRRIKTIIDSTLSVLSRTDKHFTIKINDRTSTISIDRFKPAFLLNDTDSTKKPFPVQKSSHPVVLPPRLHQNVPYQPRLALVEGSDSTRSTCELSLTVNQRTSHHMKTL